MSVCTYQSHIDNVHALCFCSHIMHLSLSTCLKFVCSTSAGIFAEAFGKTSLVDDFLFVCFQKRG